MKSVHLTPIPVGNGFLQQFLWHSFEEFLQQWLGICYSLLRTIHNLNGKEYIIHHLTYCKVNQNNYHHVRCFPFYIGAGLKNVIKSNNDRQLRKDDTIISYCLLFINFDYCQTRIVGFQRFSTNIKKPNKYLSRLLHDCYCLS